MPKRAISKKRAAEAEKEIDMDDKEATPVEDIEGRLPPAEPNQPAQQEKQPENHTPTESMSLQDLLKLIGEDNKSLKEELSNKIENTNKKIDETSKKMESDNQLLKEELSKKMDENNQSTKEMCIRDRNDYWKTNHM